MANIIRSAKSGGDWTDNELRAFNISIINVDSATFFGQAVLPPTTVSPVILNNIDMPADASKAEKKFFKLLEDTFFTEESHVDDFAACLLKLLDYDTGLRAIHSHKELGFNMCGERVSARPDVCVMDRTGRGACVLLVQEDKVRGVHRCWNRQRNTSRTDPEPQLIAEAIGAFSEACVTLRMSGQPAPDTKTLSGITMIGSAPLLYKIPLTNELLIAINAGQYPQTPTIVQRFMSPAVEYNDYVTYGMKPLDHRRAAFECLEAFKAFVVCTHPSPGVIWQNLFSVKVSDLVSPSIYSTCNNRP